VVSVGIVIRELCRLDGSCPRPGQCFAAGTLVATADGLRGIESIRKGERVWARDLDTGALELKPVTATFVRADAPIIDVELLAGAFLSERLSVTPGHRFWIEDGGWTPAASLASAPVGSFDSPVSASALSSRGDITTVYNLEVEDFHSYFVGRAGALVHNGDDGDGQDPDDCDAPTDDEAAAADANEKRMAARAAARERQRGGPAGKRDADAAKVHAFWSGRGAMDAAQSWARANGGVTLEMTGRGREALRLTENQEWEMARPIWIQQSRRYAKEASGEVHIFATKEALAREDSILNEVELPALRRNPKVTNIVVHTLP
jgi:hypothetical protein